MKKACLECQQQYRIYPYQINSSKFCSRKCQNIYFGKTHRGAKNPAWNGGTNSPRLLLKQCFICNKEFKVEKSRKDTAKYCSKRCFGANQKTFYQQSRNRFFCKLCKVEFYRKPSINSSFCSAPCRAKFIGQTKVGIPLSEETKKKMSNAQLGKKHPEYSGANHWNWKGGKQKDRHKGTQYARWRKQVFERDNYTCQDCGATGYLNAHHLLSWVNFPELRFDINNGITVCVSCHAKRDIKHEKIIYAQLKGGHTYSYTVA